MNRLAQKLNRTLRRENRIRARLHGTEERPRLMVRISNKHVYAQLINDESGTTIASASTKADTKGTMTEKAAAIGSEIAKAAKAKKVSKVVFDRGAKLYHGRVKALADAARKEGLDF
jgi:large subunit ribosomal protein L18